MPDNVTLNVGTGGDVIRTVTKGSAETPVSLIDIGGSSAELLLSASNPMPVSAATLPLPTGAATSAKQPALGTAGTASADVLSVQGVASMTALKTDGSGVIQPVSAASLPLPAGAATQATLASILTALGATVLAAGTALIGAVAAALRTDSIMNGTTSLTPKFAFVSLSATGAVVAAVSTKKIRVLRYSMVADAACTAYFRTVASTTQISGSKYIGANGGAGGTFCPVGHFETIAGEALGLVITGTANVSVDLTYVEV